jgi:predicted phosphodiesterase
MPRVGDGDDEAARDDRSTVRIALISDVHANVPALEAVLSDIDARGVDAVYQLGDLVGYGPWPNEVVEMLRRRGVQGIAGNYDSTVATGYRHCGCRYDDARQEELSHLSFAWTLEHTSTEAKRYLAALPFRLDVRPLGGHQSGPTMTLLHGNQVLNTVYVTEDRSDDFLAKMSSGVGARPGDVVAFGHTHKPWHRVVGSVHFVNTGSVGRPKDGDWRAGYVVLDINANEVCVEFCRVEYDVNRAAEAVQASTLPNEFAGYLRTGGGPTANV